MRSITLTYDSNSDLPELLSKAKIEDKTGTLIQVFASALQQETIQGLSVQLRHLLPLAQIIGTSTAGALHQGTIARADAIINIIQFANATITTAHAAFTPDGETHCFESGKLVSSHINNDETKLLFCYLSGKKTNAESLARGIVSVNPSVTLAGGIASPPANNISPWVFADDRFYESGMVLAAISGNVQVDAFHSTDWMMLGTPMQVTETHNNRLVSINNTPAKSVYSRYLGNEPEQTVENICSQFPLLTERNGTLFALACNAAGADEPLTLWGELHPSESIRFGILDPVSAMDAFHGYTRKIQEHGSQALFMFPSLARLKLMRSLTEDEARQLNSIAPTTGCFCNSQFFYHPSQKDYLHYAQTIFSLRDSDYAPENKTPTEMLGEFSQDTLQLRAMSHLMGSTTREIEENTRQLEALASTDPLTQVLNRHKMQLLLEQEYKRSQRYGRPLSLIMLDLDDFKLVNDSFGHQQGDQVLQQTSAIIQASIRDTDYLSRWGGEEFLILCPETSLNGTFETAERIRLNLEQAHFPESIVVTASLGVTAFRPEDTLDRLLHRVDRALYLSKEKGKNQVTRWS